MECEILLDRRLAPGNRIVDSVDAATDQPQVRRGPSLRCDGRRLDLDSEAELQDILYLDQRSQFIRDDPKWPTEDVVGNKHAGALPTDNQALGAQRGQRLPNNGVADPKTRDQLLFCRQTCAGPHFPFPDVATKPFGELGRAAQRGQKRLRGVVHGNSAQCPTGASSPIIRSCSSSAENCGRVPMPLPRRVSLRTKL